MIDKIKNNKLLMQILRFGIVGGLAFVVDFGVLTFLKEVFKMDTVVASTISFCISVIFNYILSIKWVFDVDKDKNQAANFVLFIIFSVIGLGINDLIMWQGEIILTKLFVNIPVLQSKAYMIVKIFATAVVMVFNFITRKLFLEKHTGKYIRLTDYPNAQLKEQVYLKFSNE